MSHGSFRRAALAGSAAVLVAAAPAAAIGVTHGPDLLVERPAPVLVQSGGRSAVHAQVLNNGGSVTAEPFTLLLQLPAGVFVAEPFSPSSCRPFPQGHSVSCTFPAGLRPGSTATADIPIFVAQGTPAGRLSGHVKVTMPGDPTPNDDAARFEIVIL